MYDKADLVIKKLTKQNKYISTMESCTGGGLVNTLTSIEGASSVLKYSAVTYSNEFKIKMGVPKSIIDKYSVYSKEVSIEMAKCISDFTASDYGIGITGKLNRVDENNPFGNDNEVFFTIYNKNKDESFTDSIIVKGASRIVNKEEVIDYILEKLLTILG